MLLCLKSVKVSKLIILSDNLKYLESKGLIYKKVIEDDGKRNTEYYLTDKGKKMNKILYEMVVFGLYELESDLRTDDYKNEIKKGYKDILDLYVFSFNFTFQYILRYFPQFIFKITNQFLFVGKITTHGCQIVIVMSKEIGIVWQI